MYDRSVAALEQHVRNEATAILVGSIPLICFGVSLFATVLFYLAIMPKMADRKDSRFWKTLSNTVIFGLMVALPLFAVGFSIYLLVIGQGLVLPILGLVLNGGPLLVLFLFLVSGVTR